MLSSRISNSFIDIKPLGSLDRGVKPIALLAKIDRSIRQGPIIRVDCDAKDLLQRAYKTLGIDDTTLDLVGLPRDFIVV